MGYGQIGTAAAVGLAADNAYRVEATPEAPLSAELSTLINLVCEIESGVSALQNRLAPVSVSTPIPTPDNAKATGRMLAPAVDAIRQSNDRLRGIRAHLNIIANDLQV